MNAKKQWQERKVTTCDLSMFMITFTSCFRWVRPMDGDGHKMQGQTLKP